jgi:hypothetical protein
MHQVTQVMFLGNTVGSFLPLEYYHEEIHSAYRLVFCFGKNHPVRR